MTIIQDKKMKKLTAEDLFALQYGDRVYKHSGMGNFTAYRYVGRMPSSPERYLIFSAGESLTHLYIKTDNSFYFDWYSGDFDSSFADKIEIEELEKRLEYLKNLKK